MGMGLDIFLIVFGGVIALVGIIIEIFSSLVFGFHDFLAILSTILGIVVLYCGVIVSRKGGKE